MNDIKSLADRLRNTIADPLPKKENPPAKNKAPKSGTANMPNTTILKDIEAYDNSDHKSMVHVRLDKKTSQMLSHFKMATGIDVTKLIAYSIRELLTKHPELKLIVKQYLQNLEL